MDQSVQSSLGLACTTPGLLCITFHYHDNAGEVGRTMFCKPIRKYTKVGLSSVVILAGLEAADEMTEACRTFPVRDECALEPPKGLSLVMVEHKVTNQPR